MTDENEPTQQTDNQPDFAEIFKKLGGLGPLALVAAIAPALGGFALLAYAGTVGDWLAAQGNQGIAIYIAGFTILAGLALLPTYAQAIVGGFAFGATYGTAAALAGFLGASLVGYIVAAIVSGNRAEDVISQQPRWKAVHDALLRGSWLKTLGIVTLIRVPPNSPFAMTNLILAATKVPVVTYAIGTLIGMAPRTFAAVYIGSTLSNLDEIKKPWWALAAGIGITVVVVLIIGVIANQALQKLTTDPVNKTSPTNAD